MLDADSCCDFNEDLGITENLKETRSTVINCCGSGSECGTESGSKSGSKPGSTDRSGSGSGSESGSDPGSGSEPEFGSSVRVGGPSPGQRSVQVQSAVTVSQCFRDKCDVCGVLLMFP